MSGAGSCQIALPNFADGAGAPSSGTGGNGGAGAPALPHKLGVECFSYWVSEGNNLSRKGLKYEIHFNRAIQNFSRGLFYFAACSSFEFSCRDKRSLWKRKSCTGVRGSNEWPLYRWDPICSNGTRTIYLVMLGPKRWNLQLLHDAATDHSK
jgi:hypothetical protein